MVNAAYYDEWATAIPIQEMDNTIAYGTCSICFARSISVLLERVSYRIPSMRNRVRELLYCSDNIECVATATARAHK